MPESPPSPGRATARAAASSRDTARAAPAAPQVRVRYYRRMRPNRVYPVVVSCKGGAAANPVTVRLILGGAQVVPLEQTLDSDDPAATVTFHVTPLARGHLRGERLEVLQQGRKVQEIRLPCQVTTQRATWVLLILTLLVAWFVVPMFDPSFKPDLMERMPPSSPEVADIEPVRYYRASEAVAVRLHRNLPRTLPTVRQHLPWLARELEAAPDRIGDMYAYLFYELVRNQSIPLGEIILGTFVLLTLLSWLLHLERRKRRVGKALAPAGGG